MSNKPEQVPAPIRLLRRRDLEACVRLSRSTIYSLMDPASKYCDATFPRPIRLGNGAAVAWIESEVQAWLRSQIVATRGDATTEHLEPGARVPAGDPKRTLQRMRKITEATEQAGQKPPSRVVRRCGAAK